MEIVLTIIFVLLGAAIMRRVWRVLHKGLVSLEEVSFILENKFRTSVRNFRRQGGLRQKIRQARRDLVSFWNRSQTALHHFWGPFEEWFEYRWDSFWGRLQYLRQERKAQREKRPRSE